MGGAPQVAMRVTSQIWQIVLLPKPFRFFVFASQTLQVFCFCFANPLGFLFGPSQKGTICSSDLVPNVPSVPKLQVLWIYFKNQNYCYAILINLLGSILLIFLQTMHITILILKENAIMFFLLSLSLQT
jgi:hypothetical protein